MVVPNHPQQTIHGNHNFGQLIIFDHFFALQVRPRMAQNTKQPTDVKAKIYEYPVILVKLSKWFEPIMEGFPSLSATKMVTLTGV